MVDNIVNWYEKNQQDVEDGTCGNRVNKDWKESKDISIASENNDEPFLTYKNKLHEFLVHYCNKYNILNTHIWRFGLVEDYNIQKYPISGGFKIEHCERMGALDSSIKRILVFMTYLNDVDDGGTEFMYLDKTIKAEKGKTLIWPSDWTHTHKGQISHTKEKIIITGWFSHIWDL